MQYPGAQHTIPATLLLTQVELRHHLTADLPDLQADAKRAMRCVTPQFPAIHSQSSSVEVTGCWIVCG